MAGHVEIWSCARPSCKTFIEVSGKWGAIKAHGEGWFSLKDRITHWCPEHVPAWVGPWREKGKNASTAQQG